MNEKQTLLDLVARRLYEDWIAGWGAEAFTPWADLADTETGLYYDHAQQAVAALGLEFEWGVQTDDHLGIVETSYFNHAVARIVFEEMEDEEPERHPVLVRRIVGQWEELQ